MANHCGNFINGANKELRDWVQKHLVDEYDQLNYLTELPIFNEEEKESKDVYDLVGTKWIDDICIDDDSETISFSSSWSPPIYLFERLSEKFNCSLNLEYEEPGCILFGYAKITNGTTEHTTYPNELVYAIETNSIVDAVGSLKEWCEDEEDFSKIVKEAREYYEDLGDLKTKRAIEEEIKSN